MKIKATKPSVDSKVGIKYVLDDTVILITSILPESIFSYGDLKVGHKVVAINGAPVSGNSMEWARTVFATSDTIELQIKRDPEMAQLLQIRVTKPTPETKLGIRYIVSEEGVLVSGINADSIFNSTKLEIGHDIVKINGTTIPKNNAEKLRAMLLSSDQTIVLDVRPSWVAAIKLNESEPATPSKVKVRSSDLVARKTRFVLNSNRNEIPVILVGRSVSLDEWEQIYDSLELDLLPAIVASAKIDELLKIEMENFTTKQMTKGYVGFGQESHHENKVFRMTQQAATLANTLTLVATNTLLLADSIVRPYKMRCQLHLETYSLEKYSQTKQIERLSAKRVRGIEFITL